MKNDLINQLEFCVVDTETTGGSGVNDRIIDIAVFRVRDGIILEKFQSLINPGVPIPSWITGLTGIDDSMVKHAPRFGEISEPLFQILSKGIFSAHNAGFDFPFVQQEFLRAGQIFCSPTVCTVRLARHLYPELPSRSLGALCDHLLIDITDRHRAAGDAEATVYVLKNLLKKAEREFGVLTWKDLELFTESGPLVLPPGIQFSDVARLPNSPGAYVFKNHTGEIIYQGKAKDVRRRVKTFFRKANQSDKSNRFREIVKSIELVA